MKISPEELMVTPETWSSLMVLGSCGKLGSRRYESAARIPGTSPRKNMWSTKRCMKPFPARSLQFNSPGFASADSRDSLAINPHNIRDIVDVIDDLAAR